MLTTRHTRLLRPSPANKRLQSEKFTKPDNVTFDARKYEVLVRGVSPTRIGGEDGDTLGVGEKALAFVYTKTKANFTLQPRMSTRRLLLLQCVLPGEDGALPPGAIDAAVRCVRAVVMGLIS
jgi:hypothetical protein